MMFPLFEYQLFGVEINLVLALFIGIAFGYFLEQAGLGHARKLADQFYLKDFTVFKVMFTAILTAMIGLFYLEYIGFLNLELISFTEAYLVPQLIGGLILGFGFIIGGYCPGTCVIGISSGHKDAVYFFIGLFVGMILFSLSYSLIEDFYLMTQTNEQHIYSLFSLSKGAVIFGISLIAILLFFLAERLEKRHAE